MNSESEKQSGKLHLDELAYQNKERLKELACINQTSALIMSGKPVNEVFQQIVDILPDGWQYPEYTVARIRFDDKEFVSYNFKETEWQQKYEFTTINDKQGSVEIYYTKKFTRQDEGPFLKEERELLTNIGSLIQGYLNSVLANENLRTRKPKSHQIGKPDTQEKKETRKLLHKFLNENNYARDIYHDLMQFKVKEILLVGTLYDAYSLESEGRFAEQVLGEYRQLNLTYTPRITGVSTEDEVIQQLEDKHYDLVIFVIGIDKKNPQNLSQKIKTDYPYIPIFFLVNNNSDLAYYQKNTPKYADRLFSWNGDSSIFFAMIKLVEDKINANNDTQIGMVRVILLVEDSAKYYSRILPLLYRVVLEQTRRIIDDVECDELYRLLRLRARPKILLAESYNEAIKLIHRYKEYLQCLITDVRYPKDGEIDDKAGFDLVDYVHDNIGELPICIQSSETGNVYKKNTCFINKNSENLANDIRVFIDHFVGFGNFVFRDNTGRQIAVAKNLKEFERYINSISNESLKYHARRNHFSLWLMARGEIQLAKILNPYKLDDFDDVNDMREFLLRRIHEFRNEKIKGKIVPFTEEALKDERNVVEIGTGALGGKGRGVAFTNTLIYNFDFSSMISDINIRAPRTVIIGIDEFTDFINENDLKHFQTVDEDYDVIKKAFKNARFSKSMMRQLKAVMKEFKRPLAIRSSSLLEDSLYQPFSGIFETYLIPNNHTDDNIRLEQFTDAIKMVYASLFSPTSKDYIRAINYKLEEEKMAVVIQEVVGNQFDSYYYPHISGVAQSFNYYPVSYMKPEDGFAVLALGLGKYVVEGEKAYRFCPRYPKLDVLSLKDIVNESQTEFFAVNMNKENIDLLEGEEAGLQRLDIDDAEMQGSLKHLASVYNPDNNSLSPGLTDYGPRVLDFANILKHKYIPLPKTIEKVVAIVKEALGTTVEIEFAVDLKKDKDNKASFYILQIKPLIGSSYDYEIDMDKIDQERIILQTTKAMGNGKITGISDIVFVDPDSFDKTKTEEMAAEIEKINKEFHEQDRKYILLGPGRWGSRDKFIGIPVRWPQISNAKVIVEYSFKGFPLDPSSGSHFFHNVTSMNVGYFSVQTGKEGHKICWDKIRALGKARQHKYFSHIRIDKSLTVKMDSKNQIALIQKPNKKD
ncbi:MAG: PEP/pyruvate-binding domain-containing protein [Bacteroidota bacterium]